MKIDACDLSCFSLEEQPGNGDFSVVCSHRSRLKTPRAVISPQKKAYIPKEPGRRLPGSGK